MRFWRVSVRLIHQSPPQTALSNIILDGQIHCVPSLPKGAGSRMARAVCLASLRGVLMAHFPRLDPGAPEVPLAVFDVVEAVWAEGVGPAFCCKAFSVAFSLSSSSCNSLLLVVIVCRLEDKSQLYGRS